MRAEILAVGSELTSGRTVNSNATYLARRLAELGIVCTRHESLPDARERIVQAARAALAHAPLVLVTGGLGPTVDDLTAEAIGHALGRPLARHPQADRWIRARYRRFNRRLSPAVLRQALVPRGAVPLSNPLGTAPGLWIRQGARVLVALPGVPDEMRAIFERSVAPRLARLPGRTPTTSVTLRTVGLPELVIQRALHAAGLPDSISLGLYPGYAVVDVRLTTFGAGPAAAQRLAAIERRLRRSIGLHLYSTNDEPLEAVVGTLLARHRRTLAVAESCTGGLVTNRLTDVPGSSRYILGGIIAYHNRVKQQLLGVPAALLARHGAVSAAVACAMAQGARQAAASDYGLAVTGIAGPSGGTPNKPVGLVYLAVADAHGAATQRVRLHGDRRGIKERATQLALDLLRRRLLNLPA